MVTQHRGIRARLLMWAKARREEALAAANAARTAEDAENRRGRLYAYDELVRHIESGAVDAQQASSKR